MKTIPVLSRYACKAVLALLVLAGSQSAMAAPAGRMAFQYVGINIVTSVTGPGAGQAFTVGYYTYIAGIPQPLFSNAGRAGEANAYFTFRSEPYSFSTFANENILVRTVSPGFLIKLYYNQTPDQNFDDPDTFSDGQLIATFKVVTSQATRVENEANQQASLKLVSAQPFWFQGRRYTIRTIVHDGVTLFSAGSAVSVDDDYTAFAYGGSALAD
jgi:hypothetical protein